MPPRAFAALLAVSIVTSSTAAFEGAASTSGNVAAPIGGKWKDAMPLFRVEKGTQIPTKGQASVEQVQQPADLRLKAGTVAIDAGELLSGINEDFAGKAPDLGA